VAFGGVVDETTSESVTVESTELTVRLNDEGGIPDTGTDGVQTCLGVGTPGDSLSVTGHVTVDVPADSGDGAPFLVVVSLAHTEAVVETMVEETGTARWDVFWVLDDDETLSTGESATVTVSVRSEGSTVTNTTETVTVEADSRSYECDDSLDARS
jgi:hypothetical protein